MSIETELTRARSLAKKGEVGAARQAYLAVLARFPGNVRAQEGLKALGGVAGAAAPASPSQLEVALHQLAKLYAEGNFAAVLKGGEELARTYPNSPQLANLLGAAHAVLGRLEEALASYARAVRVAPDYAEAHHNMANALKALGRQSEAKESYAKAIEHKPAYAEAHRNLSTLKTYAAKDTHLIEMERLMAGSRLSDRDRVHLGFALGKAHEDAGDWRKAFAHLAEANRLRKKDLGYDIAKDRHLFQDIRAVFGEASRSVQPASSPGKLARRPIFILGMPRSGTTLVEQILASHSEVHGGGEMGVLNSLATRVMPSLSKSATEPQALRDAAAMIRAGYDAALRAIPTSKSVVTDKMPSNFRWIGLIRLALPEALIVHVRRDPVATCWSMYKTYFATGGNGYCYDLSDVAEYHKLYRGLMAFWRERFPGAVYDLDYEGLTENQEAETRKLVAHCDLKWEPACLAFHKTERAVETASAAQVRRQMYTGSSDNWRKFETELQPLVKALDGSELA